MTKASRWRVAAAVVVGLFMAILDTTIVSVTLPQMQKAFHTDFGTITWVGSAYFLAQAAVIPIVGYLSDRVGTKLIFLTSDDPQVKLPGDPLSFSPTIRYTLFRKQASLLPTTHRPSRRLTTTITATTDTFCPTKRGISMFTHITATTDTTATVTCSLTMAKGLVTIV